MAFENLQDQLKESISVLRSKVMESEVFNRFRESYYTLPTRYQSLLKWGAVFVITLVLINIPFGYLKEAHYNMNHYNERKSIVRKLKSIEKQKSAVTFTPEKFNLGRFRTELENRLVTIPVSKEQITVQTSSPVKGIFPAKTQVETFEVNLNKLNVRQLSNSLRALESLNDSLMVTGLTTKADADDPHYHNLKVFVTNFSLPGEGDGASPPVITPRGNESGRGRGR